jgi:hypothetical protein
MGVSLKILNVASEWLSASFDTATQEAIRDLLPSAPQ